jgi:sarcosine oxidase gamma subunit
MLVERLSDEERDNTVIGRNGRTGSNCSASNSIIFSSPDTWAIIGDAAGDNIAGSKGAAVAMSECRASAGATMRGRPRKVLALGHSSRSALADKHHRQLTSTVENIRI